MLVLFGSVVMETVYLVEKVVTHESWEGCQIRDIYNVLKTIMFFLQPETPLDSEEPVKAGNDNGLN